MKLLNSDKGAVAVEFAIVLAFVLVPLFIGLADAGRMINSQVVLDRAAREGAVSIMRGDPYQKAIENVLSDANLDGTLVVEQVTEGETRYLKLTYTIPNFPLFDMYDAFFPDYLTSYATYQLP